MDDRITEIYEAVGNSDAPFYALVDAFYDGVEHDTALRSLYPADLTTAKEHLALFLIQRFGGHGGYGKKRGHPRLRMRHVPFVIGARERDAWLLHMRAAVQSVPVLVPWIDVLEQYFADAAEFLVNSSEIPSLQ